jgi:type IV pilus assembly protein PilN
MIRINLVAPEKPAQQRKSASSVAPGAFQFYFLLMVCVGGAFGISAIGWFSKKSEISRLDSEIAKAQERQRQLQAVKAQVDALEAKRKVFQMKVDLIERLRLEQSDPVHLLDEISKALPDFVWLKTLEQTGPTLKITGMSSGLIAVADFVSNLQRAGWFPQVDMGTAKEAVVAGSAPGTGSAIEFAVTAQFKNPATAAREAAARAAAAAAPPAASPGKGAKP